MDLRVERLEYSYPGSGIAIFEGLSLTIPKAQIFSILGPNGVGKSTLLRTLAGLLKPNSGLIWLGEQSLLDLSPAQRARKIAFVSQSEAPAFSFSVLDVVLTGYAAKLGFSGRPGNVEQDGAMAALSSLGIEGMAAQSYARLSGGQQQLVRIARAMVQQCPVILLDEPTAHLDLAYQLQVLKALLKLRDQGHTVVMTTHSPDHAHFCGGHVLMLGREQQQQGSTSELIHADVLRQIYQIELEVFQSPRGSLVCVPDYQSLVVD
ncbi:ABC transporter ATP-binding protein [Dongshaea marina]|uniref:ABC transporter ATP-binding protein n=1 Tax=Dongshaea marina TaxID=2047966 RepID=UPI000D3E7AFD|nr:ABC transporter ATP-binding protein [Dongshaea marina]